MRTNPEIPADLVTFTEEVINEKLPFLCRVHCYSKCYDCFPENLFMWHLFPKQQR